MPTLLIVRSYQAWKMGRQPRSLQQVQLPDQAATYLAIQADPSYASARHVMERLRV